MPTKQEKQEEIKQLVDKVTQLVNKAPIIVTSPKFNGENTNHLIDKIHVVRDSK